MRKNRRIPRTVPLIKALVCQSTPLAVNTRPSKTNVASAYNIVPSACQLTKALELGRRRTAMSFPNVYAHRKVADTSAKSCDICFKPSTSVLITPDSKVRLPLVGTCGPIQV